MYDPAIIAPTWLTEWMKVHKITLWGAADLRDFSTPRDETGQRFPFALSWAIPMNPEIMVSIQKGPNQAYADEYARVNHHINELSVVLAAEIKARGFRSKPLAASDRTDTINIKGDFPHKTAATRAGLGWVGRHCQLITRQFGSWIRLGTVFSDIELPCGPPIERNFCGRCKRCVEACPAKALKGNAWYPGLPREEILDALACDQWKKEHYFQYHKGHNCGICSAVCPYGIKRGTKYESVIVSGEVDEVFDINKQNAMEGLLHKYSIDQAYARNLDYKVKVFEEKTGTRKQIFLTMITTLGLKRNFYSEELVDSEVVLTDLIL